MEKNKMYALNRNGAIIPCSKNEVKIINDRVFLAHSAPFIGSYLTKTDLGSLPQYDDDGELIENDVNTKPAAEELFLDDISVKIVDEIKSFLDSEDKYKKYKVAFKRGIMLFGPPGTGKTATTKCIARLFVEKTDGVVIANAGIGVDIASTLDIVRKGYQDAPVLMIFDDLQRGDRRIDDMILAMDGLTQIDKVVFLITTNYRASMPPALLRPSRIDSHYELSGISDKAIKDYCIKKFDATKEEVSSLCTMVETKPQLRSYANIKEVMILMKVFDMSVKDAVKRLELSTSEVGYSTTVNASREK